MPSRPQQCRLGAEDVSADRGGGTDICGRPLNRARDPVIGEVGLPDDHACTCMHLAHHQSHAPGSAQVGARCSQVLFPSAPRSVLSGPEAELPRSRDELWDLVGVPLRVQQKLSLSLSHWRHCRSCCWQFQGNSWHAKSSKLLVFSHLQLTPAELDTIVSVAAGGGGGARSGFASVADCMRARQALRPAAGAHIIS